MNDKELVETIKKSIDGDKNSIVSIINQYEKLIDKYSKKNGVLNEDCKQYIITEILRYIPKFKIFK